MKDSIKHFGFNPENYKLLLIGLGVNILGYILMIGGGAESDNEFNADQLFSTVRITISPILIVLGYGIIFFSIMKKNKKSEIQIENTKQSEIPNSLNKIPKKK